MGSTEEETQKRRITREELQRHTSTSDLWISIQGKVYDVTEWARIHPGGELPLRNLAGQDASDAFIAYHPASAWKHLDRFCVGEYSDYRVSEVSRDYRRMAAEFARVGMFGRKGHGTCVSLCVMLVLFSVAVRAVVWCDSVWAHLGAGGMMGLLWIQSGWVGHDAGHYGVMASPFFDRVAEVLTGNCLTGISIGWWKHNHNAHHIACNSLDYDPDLQHIPLFAVSSEFFTSLTSRFYNRRLVFGRLGRFLISHQHWTFYPVMAVARINLFAQSILLLLTHPKVPNRAQEILGVACFWVWYPMLVSCLPTWGERAMFVLLSFSVAGIQHVQFCLNHFSSHVYVGQPTGDDWFQKQTAGTLDIACSPWMDWFHGGLQFQVEHHLFPRLPRCHLRAISPLVQDLCKKHNLTYSSATFWEANGRTLAVLRAAAVQARDLTAPPPRNLLWEALNTHG